MAYMQWILILASKDCGVNAYHHYIVLTQPLLQKCDTCFVLVFAHTSPSPDWLVHSMDLGLPSHQAYVPI